MDFRAGRVIAICEVGLDRDVRLITLYPVGGWNMDYDAWKETIMCYCAADSFEPETLKSRLQTDLAWGGEFRLAFDAALAAGQNEVLEWIGELSFQFDSEQQVSDWLRSVYDFLFSQGAAPSAPGQG